MRVRGSVNYNGDIIEITKENLTQLLIQHSDDVQNTMIMVTLLIDGQELTFGKPSIHELKLAQVEDPITQELDAVEEKIDEATT